MTHVHLLRRLGFKRVLRDRGRIHDRHRRILENGGDGSRGRVPVLCSARVACGRPALVHGGAGIRGAWLSVSRGGGEYVFLRKAYGPLTGFLYGWTRFWIASPGSIAAYAIGSVTFLESFLPVANHRPEIGNRDHRLLHRPQLLLGSVRRSGANRDDGRQDSHDLRAGGIDIDVRSSHELGSSRRRRRISGMEELVRLRGSGYRGALGVRRLEQSLDGGGRGSRAQSRDSARARIWGS